MLSYVDPIQLGWIFFCQNKGLMASPYRKEFEDHTYGISIFYKRTRFNLLRRGNEATIRQQILTSV